MYESKDLLQLVRTRSGRRLPQTPIVEPPSIIYASKSTPCTPRAKAECKERFVFQQSAADQGVYTLGDDLRRSHPNNTTRKSTRTQSIKYKSRAKADNLGKSNTLKAKMHEPLRSQSFKYRNRLNVDIRRIPLDDDVIRGPQERRRSTPNISRRMSQFQRYRYEVPRTDVWPEPKQSTVDEHYLNLPDAEGYTRVRQFKIDEKGAVVSRGDSFRLKSPNTQKKISQASTVTAQSNKSNESGESSQSTLNDSLLASDNDKDDSFSPSTSAVIYKIHVLGATGVGKTSLIGQFMTSDHCNTYATDFEQVDNTVAVLIGGKESELVFYETDPYNDDSWLDVEVHIYLLMYSIDSRSSFKQIINIVERLRESASTRNIPIVMVGNKADLERKRAVGKHEAKDAAMTFGFVNFEISVALNLDVDDLLVGLIAEIKESIKPEKTTTESNVETSEDGLNAQDEEANDFKAAIRRYSRRRREQMTGTIGVKTNMCTNFKIHFLERLRNLRRSIPKLPQ